MREFYAMSPEDAYSILEAIAEIHGCADKLKRIAMDEAQKQAEETAQEIDAEHKERQSPFRFSMCNIQPGEEIEYCNNPEIKCTVVDDKTVSCYEMTFFNRKSQRTFTCQIVQNTKRHLKRAKTMQISGIGHSVIRGLVTTGQWFSASTTVYPRGSPQGRRHSYFVDC